MSNMNKVAKELKKAMTESDGRKPKAYDTEATVTHVDGNTLWVKFPGGETETPVRRTIDAKPGDVVMVRVANHRAWTGGNSTNPPTDDTRANQVGAAAQPSIDFVAALVDKDVTVKSITAATGYIDDLYSKNITTENINAATGYIKDLTSENITAQNIVADHADVNTLKANKADIDLANVNVAWIEQGNIKKAEVFDENVFDLSGNRATLSRIDASKINVANLRADNLVVRRINGQPVVGGYTLISNTSPGYESKNPQELGWYEFVNAQWVLSTDTTVDMTKAYYQEGDEVSLYDQTYIDGLKNDLQQQIDGAVETFTGSVVPTLVNYPYTDWYDTSVTPVHDERAKHVGDIYYVVNSAADEDGYCYRFAFDETNHEYMWVLIKDTDITKALSDISELQTFESETTSWIDETDQGLETIRTNHTALSGRVDTVETTANNALPAATFQTFESTTFTDLVDEVDEQSTTMTNMTTRLGLNADGSQSATDIVAKESALEQTVGGISTRVGKTEMHLAGMYATSSTAADTAAKVATIVPALSNYELANGAMVTVKFTAANTTASPTLNLNGTGAKAIKTYSGGNLAKAEYEWKAGSTFTFTYNGTNWLMQDSTASVRMSSAETQIEQTANNVLIKATESDTTAAQGGQHLIQSLINVAPEGVKIAASHVEIDGATIFSNTDFQSSLSNSQNAYTILWDKNYGTDAAGGEAIIQKKDPLTGTITNTAGWVIWNGIKRTVPAVEYNQNTMVPYNIPVYLVLRLSSASSTTGTVYPVWYANSKWNYLNKGPNAATTDNTVANWTWVEATDIVLGSCVEPAGETIFTDCVIYDPPWTCKQVTSDTVTARSANAAANAAQTTANNAAPKANAVKRTQRIYYQNNSTTAPATPGTATSNWVTDNTGSSGRWTKKRMQYSSSNKYIWTCEQSENAAGTVSYTSVLLDDTTTVIDGGNIITGTVTANQIGANAITADKIATGAITVGDMNQDTKNQILNSEIQIGGANILQHTKYMEGYAIGARSHFYNMNSLNTPNYRYVRLTGSTADWGAVVGSTTLPVEYLDGTTEYTLSFEYKSSAAASIYAVIGGTAKGPHSAGIGRTKYGEWKPIESIPSSGSKWVKHVVGTRTMAVADLTSGSGDVNSFFIQFYNRSDNVAFDIRNIKLEVGNKATDWSPAAGDEWSSGVNILRGTDQMKSGATYEKGAFYVSNGTYGTAAFNQSVSNPPVPNATKGIKLTANDQGDFTHGVGFAQQGVPMHKGIVTYSVWAKGSANDRIALQINYIDSKSGKNDTTNVGKQFIIPDSEWNKYEWTKPIDIDYSNPAVTVDGTTYNNAAGYVYFYSETSGHTLTVVAPMLEYGTVSSSWTPRTTESNITRIDDNGIRIHPSSTEDNSVLINGNGMYIYQDNIQRAYFEANAVAIGTVGKGRAIIKDDGLHVYTYDTAQHDVGFFGSTARVGYGSGSRFLMNADSLEGWNSSNKRYFQVSASGLKYGTDLAHTVETTTGAQDKADAAKSAAEKTATNYISVIDSTGIKVKAESNNDDYLEIKSGGINIYRNKALRAQFQDDWLCLGNPSNARFSLKSDPDDMYMIMKDKDNVQRFSLTASGVLIGKAAKGHTYITDTGLHIYDENNKKRSLVDKNGLHVYDTDGSTEVANFGSTARIGKPTSSNTGNVYIDDDNIYIRKGATTLSRFTESGANIGANSDSATINLCGGKGSIYGTYNSSTPSYNLHFTNMYPLSTNDARRLLYIENDGTSAVLNRIAFDQTKSYASIRLTAGENYISVSNTAGTSIGSDATVSGTIESEGNITSGSVIYSTKNTMCTTDNTQYCGNSTHRWKAVYATTGSIQTSDRKEKDILGTIPYAKDLIMSLEPIRYMWKNGDHRRTRMGFIAQDVSDICKRLNQNLALVYASYGDEGEENEVPYYGEDVDDELLHWGLSYEQLIAPMTVVIQQQQEDIDELKTEVAKLKGANNVYSS